MVKPDPVDLIPDPQHRTLSYLEGMGGGDGIALHNKLCLFTAPVSLAHIRVILFLVLNKRSAFTNSSLK